MLKPLLAIFLVMATVRSINPAALGQDEKRVRESHQVFDESLSDRNNMTRIFVKNDTKIDMAVKQRYRRDVKGQQDPSNLCDNIGNEDYPVVVVIGDSGVGKSTFLNYIAKFNEGDQCYFEKGEANLGSGVTSETVAKQLLYTGNPNLNFIGVDTPGLSDVRGKGQDKTFMKDIATFLGNNLEGRKIALFLYVFKGTETRYQFDSLKVYNAMFGQSFFNHLAVEVTFWSHDPVSKMKRKNNRKIDEAILTQKIRDELMKSTRIEQHIAEKVPVVFVDPVYDPSDFQYYPQFMQDEIGQLQAQQESNLKEEIFDSSREGIICDADCQDATTRVIQILENDFHPIIREGDGLTIYQGTSLQLTCIVPIMEHVCPCFETSWSHKGSMVEDPGEFIVSEEEDKSGFYKKIKLYHGNVGNLEGGSYKCEANTCKLGSNICENKISEPVEIRVNRLPPKITFRSVMEIYCTQEIPVGSNRIVTFRIYQKGIGSDIENLITQHFEKFQDSYIEAGIKIERKFYDRVADDTLPGEYFCQTQFGESNRIEVVHPNVDGGWAEWGEFSDCTTTCGGGTKSRRRECTDPPKHNNGADCEGSNEETIQCNLRPCPPNIIFTSVMEISCTQKFPVDWIRSVPPVSFSIYQKAKGNNIENLISQDFEEYHEDYNSAGTVIRKRFYNRIYNNDLRGEYFCKTQFGQSNAITVEKPDVNGGWTSWGTFSQCSHTCGGGTRSRKRDCTAPEKQNNGKDCVGPNEQILQCNPHDCEENIELVQTIDGSQSIPLYVELEPRDWCCNSATKICHIYTGGHCAALDRMEIKNENGKYCFRKKCRERIRYENIKAEMNKVSNTVEIQSNCQNINIIGVFFNLDDLEGEINKCDEATRKHITIKADMITATKSMTINNADTVTIVARIIFFDSDSSLKITFNQPPATNYTEKKQETLKKNKVDGGDGGNGKTGENGARVNIIADHIVSRLLTSIVVEGGRGGDGQDGADGVKGKNGANGKYFRFNTGQQYTDVEQGESRFGGTTTGTCYYYKRVDNECSTSSSPDNGKDGTRGGNGGNGGDGGCGGSSGYIKVTILKEVHGEIITKKIGGTGGLVGAKGAGMNGGKGGKGGLGVTGSQVNPSVQSGRCYSSSMGYQTEGVCGASAVGLCSPSYYTYICYHVEVRGAAGKDGDNGKDGDSGHGDKTGTIDETPEDVNIVSIPLLKMLEKRSLHYLLLCESMEEGLAMEDLKLYMFYNERDIRSNIIRKNILSNVGTKGSEKAFIDNLATLKAISDNENDIFLSSMLSEIPSKTLNGFKTMQNEMLNFKKNAIMKDISQKYSAISFFKRKQSALLESLPGRVESALVSKTSSLRDKERADKVASELKIKLALLSIGTGLLTGGASIISERGSVATIILELNKPQGRQVGCQDNMLDDVLKIMSNHKDRATNLQDKILNEEEIGNDDKELTELVVVDLQKYKSFEISNLIERSLNCILEQNIDYQKEQSVEAKYLQNTIKEYFTANNLRLSLLEKWYEKKQELDLVQKELDISVPYTADMFADNKEAYLVLYFNQEYETLRRFHDYVAILEYKYLKCLEDKEKIRQILKLPLSLSPISTNYIDLQKLKSDLTANENVAESGLENPVFDQFYTIITDKDILKELQTTFQAKISLTDLPEQSEIVNNKEIAHHTNIRIRRIFIYLEMEIVMNTPLEIYVEVRQDAITSFDIDDYSIMSQTCPLRVDSNNIVSFETEFEMKAISKFEPTSSKSIEDQIKNHFDDAKTDLCPSDDKVKKVCSGLHSSYYINVPTHGGSTEFVCPNYGPEVNCKGLQLNNLKALHVAVQYSYRDLK